MLLNQAGANIQYPYHDLPMFSTEDRFGFWAMIGVYEELTKEMEGSGDEEKKNRIELQCEGKREDEK